jgi:hypothetical protein
LKQILVKIYTSFMYSSLHAFQCKFSYEIILIQASDIWIHYLSPLILLASYMSLGIMVTLLAWIAQRLVSSNKPIIYASAASCKANTADDWKRKSFLYSEAISLTNL